MRKAITIVAMVCISLSTVSVHAAQSTFDTDAEGWSMTRLYTFGNPPTGMAGYKFWWESTTGNPGGCIRLTEYGGPNDTFKAPAEYLGDKSSAFGTDLAFDLWTSRGGEHVSSSVAIVGSSTTLYYCITPNGGSWNHFLIPLVGSGWKKNSYLGPNATNADMLDVLGNVLALYIWGDFTSYTDEYSRLDNVFMAEAPVERSVDIDIKPGSDPNPINQGSNGLVPVAILSSPEFDATQVDPTSVSLAGANVAVRGKGKSMAHEEDVNGDGLVDLVVQVETQGLDDLGAGGTVELTGKTFSDEDIVGYDDVVIVPPE